MNETVSPTRTTRPLPAWLELWRPALETARRRANDGEERRRELLEDAVRQSGERAAAYYQKLKSLDQRPLTDGVVLRVSGPRPEIGEGRSVKLTIGGLIAVRLDFGFTTSSSVSPHGDVSPPHAAYDTMSFFRQWTESGGRVWPKDHSGVLSEPTLADFLLQILSS